MRPSWVEDAERTARSFPVVPSGVVIRLLKSLDLVMRDRDCCVSERDNVRANLHYTQTTLSKIINQLQDCRDTEAAVLRSILEAQERRAAEPAETA